MARVAPRLLRKKRARWFWGNLRLFPQWFFASFSGKKEAGIISYNFKLKQANFQNSTKPQKQTNFRKRTKQNTYFQKKEQF